MPRYFFNTSVRGVLSFDDSGLEANDEASVRELVLRGLTDLARDEVPAGPGKLMISASDASGREVWRASLVITIWSD